MYGTRLAILTLSAVCSSECLADSGGQVDSAGMRACALEQNDAKRLSCYDSEMSRLQSATPTEPPQARPVPDAAKLAGEFGYTEALAHSDPNHKAAPDKLDQLTGTITKVVKRPHGELQITLDNDQMWVEKSASSLSNELQKGDRVTIKRGALGSFYLVAGTKRSTQVTRVR